jgi:biotin carboxyl carrier protein
MAGAEDSVKLLIEVGEDTYDVEVDVVDQEAPASPRGYVPPLRARAAKRTGLKPATNGEDGRVCKSPLRGIVARVNVEPGQRVREGEIVIVLEAMKMETNIAAPRDCIVTAVAASAGDGVRVGQALVEFE